MGDDVLNITGSSVGTTVAASNVSGIETINFFDTTGATLSLLGATGVTKVASNNSTAATTFTNIGATTALGVNSSALGATFTFADVTGLSDSTTLTLNGQTAGTDVVAGVETLNIVSTGSANTLTDLTATSATTINISGDTTLNLGTGGAGIAAAATITSTNTAGVTLVSSTAAASITGGAGNDAISKSGAGADSINGGAGNDTVTYSANLDNTDTLNGGDGTDTLVSTSALLTGLTIAAPNTPIITNFETITFSNDLNGTITTANVQAGISKVNMAVAVAAAGVVNFEAGSKTLTQTAAQAAQLTINDTGTATTDTLTLDIASTVGAVDVISNNLVIGGFETVNVVTTTTTGATTQTLGSIGITPDTGGSVTLNFSGNNSVTTGVITATSATGTVHVDASGLTGTRTFSNVGAATVGVTKITGTANDDTIVGSATATTLIGGAGIDNITGGVAADSIDGGSGNDVISGAGGNDTILGGDGNDDITQGVAGSTTSIDGGAGNDVITVSGVIASGQRLGGGDGTDTLVIATADITTVNALSFSANSTLNTNITSIEKLRISNAQAANLDVSRFDNISFIQSAADSGAAGADSITGLLNNSTVEALTEQTTNTTTLSLADTTGTNGITLLLTGAAADAADTYLYTTTGIELVTITHNDADTTASGATANHAATVTVADATATSVTVDGNGASMGLTLTGNTAINTINAAGYAGNLTATSVSTVASTITGGAGADVLTGGTKADVINGGAGTDTLAGGLGADTLDGGTGVNSLNAAAMTAQTDGGNTTSSGAIINLGTTAISSGATTDHMVAAGTAVSFISGALSEIGAGKAGYLFASNAAGASSYLDTISNFTQITGTAGDDYIVGNDTGAQSITGGDGADYLTGGTGVDTYTATTTTSVASTVSTFAGANAAAGDSFVFGNGVDVIANFTAGASGDVLNIGTAGAAITGIGLAKGAFTTNKTIFLSGAYVEATGTFTVAADGSGADTMIVDTTGGAANMDNDASTAVVILIGVDSDNLVAANFV